MRSRVRINAMIGACRCNMQHVARNNQHAACNMRHAIRNMQHSACDMKHPPCEATCRMNKPDDRRLRRPMPSKAQPMRTRKARTQRTVPLPPTADSSTGARRPLREACARKHRKAAKRHAAWGLRGEGGGAYNDDHEGEDSCVRPWCRCVHNRRHCGRAESRCTPTAWCMLRRTLHRVRCPLQVAQLRDHIQSSSLRRCQCPAATQVPWLSHETTPGVQ